MAKLTLGKGEGAEKVAAKILKGISDKRKIGQGRNMKLKQQKGGRPLTATIRQKRKNPKSVHVKTLTVAKIMKKMNLSDRSTEKLYRILREEMVNFESNTRKFHANIDKF